MTRVEIRCGRVSGRLCPPNALVSNLVRKVVPSGGRSYDPVSSEWVVSGARLSALVDALRAAGVEVIEVGGST